MQGLLCPSSLMIQPETSTGRRSSRRIGNLTASNSLLKSAARSAQIMPQRKQRVKKTSCAYFVGRLSGRERGEGFAKSDAPASGLIPAGAPSPVERDRRLDTITLRRDA